MGNMLVSLQFSTAPEGMVETSGDFFRLTVPPRQLEAWDCLKHPVCISQRIATDAMENPGSPSPYAAPLQRDCCSLMPQIVVFPNRSLRELQSILHLVPFAIGVAESAGLLTSRTLHRLFVGERVRRGGFAINDFRECCRHLRLFFKARVDSVVAYSCL